MTPQDRATQTLARVEAEWTSREPAYWVGVLEVALQQLIRQTGDQ